MPIRTSYFTSCTFSPQVMVENRRKHADPAGQAIGRAGATSDGIDATELFVVLEGFGIAAKIGGP